MTLNDVDRLELPDLGPPGLDPFWDDPDKQGGSHFDRAGNRISFRDWARLREYGGRDYIVVQQDTVGAYFVSTVWLGIDHGWMSNIPIIFETMVFKEVEGERSGTDLEMQRYSTEEQAREGHAYLLAQVEAMVSLES